MIAPITLVATLALSLGILAAPRKRIVPLYVAGMCFVPADQAIVFAGLDFQVLRILAMVGCLRILMHKENQAIQLNAMDKLVIAWAVMGTLAYTLLWGTASALVSKLGNLVDTLMIYYVFRCYLRNLDDFVRAMHALVASLIVLTPLVAVEHFLGINPFSVMGRELTSVREGRVRCSAAFSHAILLGSYSASIAPIAIALLLSNRFKRKSIKLFYVLGVVCSIYVTVASASSGPIIALAAGIVCVLGFRYRRYTGLATYGILLLATLLHIVMKAPVWHLISRIDVAGGSTGYHRYLLIDKAITNFGEWALVGVKGVAHWGIHAGDVTSEYILQATRGGLLTLAIFIWMLFLTMRTVWKLSTLRLDMRLRWLFWGFFCSFVCHVLSFLSVAYFGQIVMLLMLGFAAGAFFIQNRKALGAQAKAAIVKNPTTTSAPPLSAMASDP